MIRKTRVRTLTGVAFRFFLLVGVVLVASNCASYPRNRVYRGQFPEGALDNLRGSPITVRDVVVLKNLDAEKVKENSFYILRLLFPEESRNPTVGQGTFSSRGADNASLALSVRLKEDSFIQDFRSLNTIAVEFVLWKGTTPLFTGLYAEETDQTLSSYSYLYRLLERATREVR